MSGALLVDAWFRNLFSVKTLSSLLSSFGAFWLLIQLSRFFFPNTPFAMWLPGAWLPFLLLGLIVAISVSKPNLKYSAKLNGRDTFIEVAIGNIFKHPGAIVVGSNTTFDTEISRNLISERSVQGQFTRKYYADRTQLDAELESGLRKITSTPLSGSRVGKSLRYPVGTVVRLSPRERNAYFVAIADINQNGVAQSSFEYLRVAFANLWQFIATNGLKEPLLMPILGTGFSRVTAPREEVIFEIVRSFVAACSERVFCDKLTIVISPKDLKDYGLTLEKVGAFVRYICTYTQFSEGTVPSKGQPETTT